jgi:hypothetical protein
LEVTTKLPVKLNYPVIDVSTLKGALNRYPKIPFTNTFEIRFFVSVKYDEIWRGGAVFKRDNIECYENEDSFYYSLRGSTTKVDDLGVEFLSSDKENCVLVKFLPLTGDCMIRPCQR